MARLCTSLSTLRHKPHGLGRTTRGRCLELALRDTRRERFQFLAHRGHGIDCGARDHYVAVPPDRDAQPVWAFCTFTADLNRLADWLR